MKKQFIIFLILIFVLGLVPVNFSLAITQNQIDAEVQIVCPDSYGNVFSGSGTIIDSKGIILTNKHVVTDLKGGDINICVVGFIESTNKEPNFGTENNLNLAEVKYTSDSNDMDAAVLYLQNKNNKTFPFINIWEANSDNLKFGEKIEILGFPGIGGSTVTYTSGDFSGYGSNYDGTKNYIKTSAPVEHGNSGGAAYNSAGDFIGIPTMVVAGTLNSLSYILSVNSIKKWLNSIEGLNYKQNIINNEPLIQNQENQNLKVPQYLPPDINQLKPEGISLWPYDDNNVVTGKGYIFRSSDWLTTGQYDKFRLGILTSYIYLMNQKGVDNLDRVYVSYSKNIDELNEKNELEYILPIFAHWDPNKPEENLYNELVTPIINLTQGPGTYYFGLRFKNLEGNVSDRFIMQYSYEGTSYNSQEYQVDNSNTEIKKMLSKLSGSILLQVQSRGEAYYLYNKNKSDYLISLGNENQAFTVLKQVGLGVKHSYINSYINKIFPKTISGKILIDVEDNGKAYYVDPRNLKGYYLGRPADAFKIMRERGLGISNTDINKLLKNKKENWVLLDKFSKNLNINKLKSIEASIRTNSFNLKNGKTVKIKYNFIVSKNNINNKKAVMISFEGEKSKQYYEYGIFSGNVSNGKSYENEKIIYNLSASNNYSLRFISLPSFSEVIEDWRIEVYELQ